MDDDPTWGELLLGFVLMMGIPVAVVGGAIYGLVGLILWATAPERRWRRRRAHEGAPEDAAQGRG
ncbi:hypothetical protein ACFFSH_25565 [Streptomyces filamentosus]|uniref:Uncharacterized protein n=1 Tax=Streptomyces filamentosus TaxID=67294 RepID=A0A919ETN0_STRFL|nr:hypothetical protein [Streptomyces filamentosus]GHG28676.1 hypothetical protein GCM10017667_77380 [Streptomyces filamentosus]